MKAWPTRPLAIATSRYSTRRRRRCSLEIWSFLRHIPVLDGSIQAWLQAAGRSSRRCRLRRVVPGHGPVSDLAAKPLPLNAGISKTLASGIRKDVIDGKPIAEATKHAAEAERGKWELFDDYNVRNATAAYSQFEWE